jgi:DNA-binding transcriptional LysR family regulator
VDTSNLRAFLAVVAHGSVSAAARELSMTQGGMSMILRRLEANYGVKLVRRHRGVTPTAAGEALAAFAREVLRLEGQLQPQLERARQRDRGWVGVGATPTIARYLLPQILSEFHRRHPDWTVTVETPGLVAMQDRILKGELDFSIMPEPASRELRSTPFCTERALIVAAPGHPLASRQAVPLAEVLQYPFVVATQQSVMARLIQGRVGSSGAKLKVALEVIDADAKKEAIKQGMGYGLVSESLVRREIEDGTLSVVPVAGPPLMRELYLAHPADGELSPAAAALFEDLLASGADERAMSDQP